MIILRYLKLKSLTLLVDISIKIVLKYIDIFTTPVKAHLINDCISRGNFPNILKIDKIVLVYRSSPQTDIDYYRQVSVLNVFSKFYEKILFKSLYAITNVQFFLLKDPILQLRVWNVFIVYKYILR